MTLRHMRWPLDVGQPQHLRHNWLSCRNGEMILPSVQSEQLLHLEWTFLYKNRNALLTQLLSWHAIPQIRPVSLKTTVATCGIFFFGDNTSDCWSGWNTNCSDSRLLYMYLTVFECQQDFAHIGRWHSVRHYYRFQREACFLSLLWAWVERIIPLRLTFSAKPTPGTGEKSGRNGNYDYWGMR